MTKVNLVFDDTYDDVDIIAVPDSLVVEIRRIGQEFLYWLPSAKDEEYWVETDGEKCLNAETEGFIKWLNTHYCTTTEAACIIEQHTRFCPEYPRIDF